MMISTNKLATSFKQKKAKRIDGVYLVNCLSSKLEALKP